MFRLDGESLRWSPTGLATVWAVTTHEGLLFAGASDGLYVWEPVANRWTAAGMDSYFVRALAPSTKGLYVATLGNGVFLAR